MVLSEPDDELFKKHQELCEQLNLDARTLMEAWKSFESIKQNFTLEGDPLHWLGCAIFVACRVAETPTVSRGVLEGNCVSLTSLLRYSGLSFAQFFCNIKHWADMANMPEDFRKKINHLKDTFSIAYNTFKEFHPLFIRIFRPPETTDMDQSKQHRNRKQRPVPCNSSKVFEFTWNLFITIKSEEPEYSRELIKSYHLLYACLDYVFKNAFLADRRDLLNSEFEALPPDWMNPSFEVPEDAPCLIGIFCDSMLTEALHVKQYICKRLISNLFRQGTLTGNEQTLTEVFDPQNFEINFKNITKAYETKLLNKGDFDERIFLAEYRRQLLEREQTQNWMVPSSPFNETGVDSPRNVRSAPAGSETPLTGRRFVGPSEGPFNATQTITRLHSMLSGRTSSPSEALVQLFQSCATNPSDVIIDIVTSLGDSFVEAYPLNSSDVDQQHEARNRLHLGTVLFYKLIENILQNEKTIRKDISALVEKELFYQCILACSLEIVIFSYNSPRKFPWILDTLKIEPYHFVKVIELVVRSREPFSRDLIKHLSRIEEAIMESLAWRSSSQLWEAIRTSGEEIPKFEEIALPGHLLYTDQDTNGNGVASKNQNTNPLASPMQSPPPSATETFQSPVNSQNSTVNRQLFPSVQAGQSVLQKHTHLMITDKDGNRKLIPIVETATPQQQQQQPQQPSNPPAPEQPNNIEQAKRPRKTGSLPIIFRKFYNLAGVRMEHLCTKLHMTDFELKRKIWTVFEHSIRNHTELMKDRHLDQLLMCAVYVICKVSNSQHNFTDIMKSYREQPQADSHIYRNVLLKAKQTVQRGDNMVEVPEVRGDLIKFYNNIYVEVMKKFALQFASSNGQKNDLLLSPMPLPVRPLVGSLSMKVVGNVFVKPLDHSNAHCGPVKSYYFSRSPSKDLKDINRAINNNGVSGKRLLVEGDLDIPNTKRISNRKLQSLVEERRSQNNTE